MSELHIFAAAGVTLVSTLLTTGAVAVFLCAIPADYFVARGQSARQRIRRRPLRLAYTVGKNALGVAIVLLGLVMACPGVPGQGLLTAALGLLLLDIPGKRGVVLALLRRPAIERMVNKLRQKRGKKPIDLEMPPSARDDMMKP